MSSMPMPPDADHDPARVALALDPERALDRLPAPVTSLVGRERERAMVSDLLRHGKARLVVLTGPGGVGKTRLALQLSYDLRGDYADGVWFVPLAAVSDPDEVIPAIARALGVRESVHRSITERLVAHLEDRHTLLVLDNVEQVVDAAPHLGALLTSCPRLSMLVTSRIVLRLAGERDVGVGPLTVPAGNAVEGIAASEAGRLFLERAQAACADFTLTAGNAADIAAICRRLEGLPLALELAAARIAHLPPDALLARLEPRLAVLTSGPRDAPTRLQTMRNAIAWSYDLLAPAERAVFRRLAVFVGGFSLEAAETVAFAGDEALAGSSALDIVASLIDQSLVQRVDAP